MNDGTAEMPEGEGPAPDFWQQTAGADVPADWPTDAIAEATRQGMQLTRYSTVEHQGEMLHLVEGWQSDTVRPGRPRFAFTAKSS